MTSDTYQLALACILTMKAIYNQSSSKYQMWDGIEGSIMKRHGFNTYAFLAYYISLIYTRAAQHGQNQFWEYTTAYCNCDAF